MQGLRTRDRLQCFGDEKITEIAALLFVFEWASKQHVSRMENGERSCSIDLLIELSCILHVSTDYLLMGSEPSKEEVKKDLLSIISELSTIAKKI
mgnify:CR=1 FL=1